MLESIEKFFRQNWKVITSILLALTALSLVIAFPSFVIFLGDLVLFGGTPFEFLSLMMLSEVPFFMWLASFFASVGAFITVLAASAVFNYATKIYNYCFEKMKQFWHKHPTVVLLLAALVLVATIALMVVTQSWVIPVAVVVFHVVSQLIKWLDAKINPKCDLILLPPPPAGSESYDSQAISPEIQKQMRCGRSYFLFNQVKNGIVTSLLYEAKRCSAKGVNIFEPIALKDAPKLGPDASQSRAEFVGMFPKSKDSPNKMVSALEKGIKNIKDWRADPDLSPPSSPIIEPTKGGNANEVKEDAHKVEEVNQGQGQKKGSPSLPPMQIPASGDNTNIALLNNTPSAASERRGSVASLTAPSPVHSVFQPLPPSTVVEEQLIAAESPRSQN